MLLINIYFFNDDIQCIFDTLTCNASQVSRNVKCQHFFQAIGLLFVFSSVLNLLNKRMLGILYSIFHFVFNKQISVLQHYSKGNRKEELSTVYYLYLSQIIPLSQIADFLHIVPPNQKATISDTLGKGGVSRG